jgi:hypothetical protein
MKLTRRDALSALAAAGITSTAGCAGLSDTNADASPMETLVGVADVLYPSEVEPTEDFIETFMFGRITDEKAYRERLTAGIETLNGLADEEFGSPFLGLGADERVTLFEETALRSGESVPGGNDIEQLNYHVLDELLFAFYSSPKGGELVGNPNPRGFPGGMGYNPGAVQ